MQNFRELTNTFRSLGSASTRPQECYLTSTTQTTRTCSSRNCSSTPPPACWRRPVAPTWTRWPASFRMMTSSTNYTYPRSTPSSSTPTTISTSCSCRSVTAASTCARSTETSTKRLGPVSCVNLQIDIIAPRDGGILNVKWRAGSFYQVTVAEWDYRAPLFAIKICIRWRQHFDHFYLSVSRLLIQALVAELRGTCQENNASAFFLRAISSPRNICLLCLYREKTGMYERSAIITTHFAR